jgi:hypothetical protein
MSVLVEGISVIVQESTLTRLYPGGVEQYESDCPNATFCRDGYITRVGFMAPPDVKRFVQQLVSHGLQFHDAVEFIDIAVVDQHQGPTSKCRWLEAGKHPAGFYRGMACREESEPDGVSARVETWRLGEATIY